MAITASSPERVFISYSHGGDPHDALVLNLANQLRLDGIAAMCDQYCPAPPEGWPKWMEKEIKDADLILIICTSDYRRRLAGEQLPVGKGVIWEADLIYQLIYNAAGVNARFIPVLFPGASENDIPTPLQRVTHYSLAAPFSFQNHRYEELYRRITNQPSVEVPKLGIRHSLPPVERSLLNDNNVTQAAEVTRTPVNTAGPALPQPPSNIGPPTGDKRIMPEAKQSLSFGDLSTLIGLVVNIIAIISFVLGNTSRSELFGLAGVIWVFSLGLAIGWPRHRRAAIALVCILPLLLGSGFFIRQWRRACPQNKVCVVLTPFDRDDGGRFQRGLKNDLLELKNLKKYDELQVVTSVPANDDEEQTYADARKIGATLVFWGDFTSADPTGAGRLISAYRIFGIDAPLLSQGQLVRNDNIPNEYWNKSFVVQEEVQKKGIYLTKVALGLMAWKRKDFDNAIIRLSDALANAPPDESAPARAEVYLYRGLAFAQRRRFNAAVEDYKTVLSLDSTQTTALREMGNAYFAQSLFTEAIQSFTECIARDQRDAVAFDTRGLARLRRGTAAESGGDSTSRQSDIALARSDLEKAIEIDPHLASAFNHRALLYFAQNNAEGALADLNFAVKLSPHYTDALDNLGRVYTRLERWPEAIAAYTKAKETATSPFDTVADAERGTAYVASHQYPLAIADFTKVLGCQPTVTQICDSSQVAMFSARANAYDVSGRYDDALADFGQAMLRESDPKNRATLHYNVGRVFNEKGEVELAFSNLSQAIALDKTLANAYYERANIRKKQQDFNGAIADLKEFLMLTTDENARAAANYQIDELRKLPSVVK